MDLIKQNPGFEFLNLEGCCPAEREILLNIIRITDSKEYSRGLFCFDTPFLTDDESDQNIEAIEFGQGEGEDLMTTESSENVSINSPSTNTSVEITEVSAQAQNGTVLALSPHQNVNQAGVVSSHTHTMPTYYPGQHHIAASGGVGPVSMGPSSVHNSGNQMMMFAQSMPQMIQTPTGFYPSHYYGPPQTGGQSHMPYLSQTEQLSPDSNYISPGQMHHKQHDPHHHSSSASGQGPNSYGKNRRKQQHSQQQQQPQQQQQYFYPATFFGNVPYFNQQLAQNVTGPPIIMTAQGMYPYPSQHQPHQGVYSQGPQGTEMEHHPGMGAPQSMTPMSNEMAFAQHHSAGPNPQMYSHNSPTHSNSRMGFGPSNHTPSNRTAHPQNDHLTVSEESASENSSQITENEITLSDSSSVSTVIDAPQLSNGIIMDDTEAPNKEEIQEFLEENVSHKESPSNYSSISSTPVVNGDLSLKETPNVDEIVKKSLTESIVKKSLTESIVHDAKNKNNKSEVSSDKSRVNKELKPVMNSKKQTTVDDGIKEKLEGVSLKQVSVNGDINNDSNSDKMSSKNRDISADPENSSLIEGKRDTEKSSSSSSSSKPLSSEIKLKGHNNNNSSTVVRNVNVNFSSKVAAVVNNNNSSNSEVETRKSEDGRSGDFPNLSNSASHTTNESRKSTEPAHAKTWANIASVKSSIPNDGATATRPPQSAAGGGNYSVHNFNNSVYNKSSDQNVPMYLDEKAGSSRDINFDPNFDTSLLTDENDPIAIRLGEHLQKYNLDHQSMPLSPRGLCNQSNYCFLNATLQALLACPTFVNMFRSMTPILGRAPSKATPIIQSVFSFVNEFQPLIRGGNHNKKDRMRDTLNVGPSLEPTGIRKCLGLLEGDTFKVEGRQEDAEEFLSHLLNGLHDEMIKVIKWSESKKERAENKDAQIVVLPLVVNGGPEELHEDEDDDQWQVMGAKNKSCLTRKTTITKSPISEAFLGQMCSSLSRVNAVKSATLQPFYTLQLDIQNDNIRSVRDALESISTKEEVSGVTSSTGTEVEAWRQLSLEELPPVLILHLKRFVYEKNGNKIIKIDKKLEFGVDLEIGKELLSNTMKGKCTLKQRQYKLFAVVYHDGEEAHKGHYVADCFHTSGGSLWGQWGWLRYDDTAVKQVGEGLMLNPQPPRVPYLLYYRRQDTIQQQIKKERS